MLYHLGRGLAALLILIEWQSRPDDGISKSMTPTSFLFSRLRGVLLACTTAFGQGKTTRVDYKESSARTLEATHQIFTTPLVADLKITGEKVYHIEKDAFADYIVDEDIVNYISDFKKIALGCAVKKYNADAFVGTVFDVVTDPTGHLVITVSGYPATYTNFRNATTDDLTLIKEAERANDNRQNKVVLGSPESLLKKENIKLEK